MEKAIININKWNEQEYCDKLVDALTENPNTEMYYEMQKLADEFQGTIPMNDKLINLPLIERSFVKSVSESSIYVNGIKDFLEMIYSDYLLNVLCENLDKITFAIMVKMIKKTDGLADVNLEELEQIVKDYVNQVALDVDVTELFGQIKK